MIALALGLAACGSDAKSSSSTSSGGSSSSAAPNKAKDTSVGMALPGPQNDKGFNEAHYKGMQEAAKDLGVKTNVQENVTDPAARIDALRNLAADNQLVIGVGAEFAEAGLTIAPQFPDTEFVVINGQTDPSIKNLHVYGVRQGVPAYIAGVLSPSLKPATGAVTKVGMIGGEEIPPTVQINDGYKAGVKSAGPSVSYASTITGDFNDVGKAKDAAKAQIADGAQVINGAVDAGFAGVVQAAQEAGDKTLLFSVIFPQCETDKNIVGTQILNSDQLVETIVKDYLHDTIPAEPKFYGVEDPNIQRLELCPNFKTPENQKIVDDTTKGINDGSIKLPKGV